MFYLKIIRQYFLSMLILMMYAFSSIAEPLSQEQEKVINRVNEAAEYIKVHGKDQAMVEFRKEASLIFAVNYVGVFIVSPLHPDFVGANQFNYKDSEGQLVVQEEINKAKAGGGWLPARWRKNPATGKYACRKIYVRPMSGEYLIGSWYHYAAIKKGDC